MTQLDLANEGLQYKLALDNFTLIDSKIWICKI